jgi:Fe2+ or Zn2+ uptake regulation protein
MYRQVLEAVGVRATTPRLAVASYVLTTQEHPSADKVWERARHAAPMISRASVYNTLNLFVRKGLLRELVLEEGRVVYDPNTSKHHHFIDDRTGEIHDVPWDALEVKNIEALEGVDVREYQVVLRGRSKKGARR